VAEVSQLGAQLPMLMQGFYHDGSAAESPNRRGIIGLL
jgi:uncharacterized protein (DUF2267 family)